MEYKIKSMRELVPETLRQILKANEQSEEPLSQKDRDDFLAKIEEMERRNA